MLSGFKKYEKSGKYRVRIKNPDPEFREIFLKKFSHLIVNNFCKKHFFLKLLFFQKVLNKRMVFWGFHIEHNIAQGWDICQKFSILMGNEIIYS